MIKDIVVNLSVGKQVGPAANYAVSVAAAFDAHLAGIAFLYDPIPRAGFIETQERENLAATKIAIDRFAKAAASAGIAANSVTLRAGVAGAGNQFGRLARRFDLAVVGQAEPETSAVEEVIVEAALFDSGRPVIVVPYIQKAPLKLDRVMVTWDGGRPAARAIGDAMPLLKRAGRIEVVIVANERSKQDEIEGADMAQHLARHGLNVEVKRTRSSSLSIDSRARGRQRDPLGPPPGRRRQFHFRSIRFGAAAIAASVSGATRSGRLGGAAAAGRRRHRGDDGARALLRPPAAPRGSATGSTKTGGIETPAV